MAERQKIIETNRSIRSIKNELESLLEKDVITYESYRSIHGLLPAEASLNGATATAAAAPPTPDLNALSLNNNNNPNTTAAPPTYHQTTAAAPPALPTRTTTTTTTTAAAAAAAAQPPPPPPSKPVIAHARALYAYAGADARDVGLERGDAVQVYEYMNADWWMGRNARTGAEGIFPRTYVEPVAAPAPAPAYGAYGAYGPEKAAAPERQNYNNNINTAAGGSNPYHSAAPPAAIANGNEGGGSGEGGAGGKAGNMGKKLGKKLGNAAIFGAGATIGSNIVNSIF